MVQKGPWKLLAHWQENDPTELIHVAPFRQGRRKHSLMSAPQSGPYTNLDYILIRVTQIIKIKLSSN